MSRRGLHWPNSSANREGLDWRASRFRLGRRWRARSLGLGKSNICMYGRVVGRSQMGWNSTSTIYHSSSPDLFPHRKLLATGQARFFIKDPHWDDDMYNERVWSLIYEGGGPTFPRILATKKLLACLKEAGRGSVITGEGKMTGYLIVVCIRKFCLDQALL